MENILEDPHQIASCRVTFGGFDLEIVMDSKITVIVVPFSINLVCFLFRFPVSVYNFI